MLRSMAAPGIRFRVDFGLCCSVGAGKIALLEGIARTGSLSQAAREMAMSYRRAWLLLNSMNTSFDEPVVTTSTGGSGGGGAALTRFGEQLLSAFRDLEPKLLALTEKHLGTIAAHAQAHPRGARAAGNRRRSLSRGKRSSRVEG
jgi:molybdate transport system regulatory protein